MRDPTKQSGESDVKAQLKHLIKELMKDIAIFIDNASEEQQRVLLSLLENRRLLGLLQSLPQKDRRKDPRKSCCIAVDCSAWGDAFKVFVKDISLGGMFILCIETDKVLSVGQQITVNFPTLANKR